MPPKPTKRADRESRDAAAAAPAAAASALARCTRCDKFCAFARGRAAVCPSFPNEREKHPDGIAKSRREVANEVANGADTV